MSRIPDNYLDVVVYFYPTEEDARKGEKRGGCGFMVGIPATSLPGTHLYIITCLHVARGCRFIRINKKDGDFEIIEPRSYIHHKNFDDIAVYPFSYYEQLKLEFIYCSDFLTKDIMEQHDIGIGDNVRIIGRYSLHDGKKQNLPSLREGAISIMPLEPITHHSGLEMAAFIVEMRSRNGYSGSPVFVYFDKMQIKGSDGILIKQPLGRTESFQYLLGIDIGHFESYEPVKISDKSILSMHKELELSILSNDGNTTKIKIKKNALLEFIDGLGLQVNVSSGMTMVIPAWKILEVLEYDQLKQYRQKSEENILLEQDSHV